MAAINTKLIFHVYVSLRKVNYKRIDSQVYWGLCKNLERKIIFSLHKHS